MPNAKDIGDEARQRILLVGPTGSGKSSQIWTLPGRKFAYFLDPNSVQAVKGLDLDYEQFMPDVLEVDATLKGFNKNSRSDRMPGDLKASKREPVVYMKWVEDFNSRYEKGFFKTYDWLIIDSLTFLNKATMARQLYINNRYGDVEDLADYRVVGSKITEVITSIAGTDINLLVTGHVDTFQDDKTKKIDTQIATAGGSKKNLPLVFTNIWLADTVEGEKGVRYVVRTRPDPKGLKTIRTSLRGLDDIEDVTIGEFNENSSNYGIGRLLKKGS